MKRRPGKVLSTGASSSRRTADAVGMSSTRTLDSVSGEVDAVRGSCRCYVSGTKLPLEQSVARKSSCGIAESRREARSLFDNDRRRSRSCRAPTRRDIRRDAREKCRPRRDEVVWRIASAPKPAGHAAESFAPCSMSRSAPSANRACAEERPRVRHGGAGNRRIAAHRLCLRPQPPLPRLQPPPPSDRTRRVGVLGKNTASRERTGERVR